MTHRRTLIMLLIIIMFYTEYAYAHFCEDEGIAAFMMSDEGSLDRQFSINDQCREEKPIVAIAMQDDVINNLPLAYWGDGYDPDLATGDDNQRLYPDLNIDR